MNLRFIQLLTLIILFRTGMAEETFTSEKVFDSGYTFFINQDFENAIFEFDKFIETVKMTDSPAISKIAMIFRYKAECYKNLLLYPAALHELQQAVGLYHQVNDTGKVALCYVQMADLFEKENKPSQAVYYLEEALPYFRDSKWYSRIQSAYLALGRIQFSLNEYREASDNLFKALKIAEDAQFSFDNSYIEDEAYYLLSQISEKENNDNQTLSYLTKADSINQYYCRELPGKFNLRIKIKLALANIYRKNDDLSHAWRNIQMADSICRRPSLSLYEPLVAIEKINYFHARGNTYLSHSLLEGLQGKIGPGNGNIIPGEMKTEILLALISHYQERFQQEGKMADLISKFDLLEELIDLTYSQDRVFSIFNDLVFHSQNTGEFFRETVRTALAVYQLTNDSTYLEKGFYYSELGYREMLHENFRYSSQMESNEISRSELIRIAGLKYQLNKLLLQDNLSGAESTGNRKRVVHFMSEIEQGQISLLKKNRFIHFPGIIQDTIITWLQKSLRSDEVYVKYYDAETEIDLFIITGREFRMFQVAKDRDFIHNFKIFDEFMRQSDPSAIQTIHLSAFGRAGHYLYQKLVQPYEEILCGKQLIAEVNGSLNNISLDALLTDQIEPGESSLKEYPFLIRKYKIRYSPSAAAYVNSLKSSMTFEPEEILCRICTIFI